MLKLIHRLFQGSRQFRFLRKRLTEDRSRAGDTACMAEARGEDGVEAVVFDLDGVLLESEQVWAAAKRELTERRGGTWKPAAEHEMLGMSSPEWSRYMREELGLRMSPHQISSAVVELMVD